MEPRIWGAAIALALVIGLAIADSGTSLEGCRPLSAGESILLPLETCPDVDFPVDGVGFVGVVQGDENALQRAANLVVTSRDQYVAVLFYASWCSFSRTCLPTFNSMAVIFPNIPHFAFEESAIRPSILSRYGVHGFPTLFLLHSSMRVRYHGSRSIRSLSAFYFNLTGIKPTSMESTTMNRKAAFVSNFTRQSLDQENCPFSWARSPEKMLKQDTYLALASYFLILRLLCFVLPKLIAFVKQKASRGHKPFTSLMRLWDYSRAFLRRAKRGFRRLNPCKRRNLQKGAVRAWASRSCYF